MEILSNILRGIHWLIRERLPVLLGFFVGGIVVGFFLGRHYSPQPEKIKVAAAYLLLYGNWSTDSQEHDSIVLKAYPYTYGWTSGSPTVSKHLLPSDQLTAASVSEHKDWDTDFKDLLMIAVAAPAGSLAASLLGGGGTAEKMGKTELIAASVVTLGGVFLGYELGHRSEPDTSDEKFIKNMENTELWAGADRDFRELFNWNIRACISGIYDQKDINTFPHAFGSMSSIRHFRTDFHPEIRKAACAEAEKQKHRADKDNQTKTLPESKKAAP